MYDCYCCLLIDTKCILKRVSILKFELRVPYCESIKSARRGYAFVSGRQHCFATEGTKSQSWPTITSSAAIKICRSISPYFKANKFKYKNPNRNHKLATSSVVTMTLSRQPHIKKIEMATTRTTNCQIGDKCSQNGTLHKSKMHYQDWDLNTSKRAKASIKTGGSNKQRHSVLK